MNKNNYFGSNFPTNHDKDQTTLYGGGNQSYSHRADVANSSLIEPNDHARDGSRLLKNRELFKHGYTNGSGDGSGNGSVYNRKTSVQSAYRSAQSRGSTDGFSNSRVSNNSSSSHYRRNTNRKGRSDDDSMLDSLGLSWLAIDNTDGQMAVEMFPEIILKLAETTVSKSLKVGITVALLSWQGIVPMEVVDSIFMSGGVDIFKVLQIILLQPDDVSITGYGDSTYQMGDQMPGYYLAQFIQRHFLTKDVVQDEGFVREICRHILVAVKGVGDANMTFLDKPSPECAGTVRTQTLLILLQCLPSAGAYDIYADIHDPIASLQSLMLRPGLPNRLRSEVVHLLGV